MRDIGLNDTRTALLGVLLRMGAQVREAVEDVDQLEPRGIVEITGVPLKGTVIQGREVPQLIDELPILAVAGAWQMARRSFAMRRSCASRKADRIAAIAHNLRAMGAQVTEMNDGLEIHGPAAVARGARSEFRRSSRRDGALPLRVSLPTAKQLFRMPTAFANLIRVSKPFSKSSRNPKRMQISTPVIGSL